MIRKKDKPHHPSRCIGTFEVAKDAQLSAVATGHPGRPQVDRHGWNPKSERNIKLKRVTSDVCFFSFELFDPF